MGVVDTSSLARTIDMLEESLYLGRFLPDSDREEAARWLVSRQGKPGAYANMFSPADADFMNGARVFTGEEIRSRAAIGHILGEEACRILILLKVNDSSVKESLKLATKGMLARLGTEETANGPGGFYCCGFCSVAFWRHLAAGGLDRNEERLVAGMKDLKSLRIGNGRWRRFPFYYTLLALSEMDPRVAGEEMRYSAPVLERYLTRRQQDDNYSRRRRILCANILAKCY